MKCAKMVSKSVTSSFVFSIKRGEEQNREEGEIGSKSREGGEIGSKCREKGEIGSESREKGDLPPCSSPLYVVTPSLWKFSGDTDEVTVKRRLIVFIQSTIYIPITSNF